MKRHVFFFPLLNRFITFLFWLGVTWFDQECFLCGTTHFCQVRFAEWRASAASGRVATLKFSTFFSSLTHTWVFCFFLFSFYCSEPSTTTAAFALSNQILLGTFSFQFRGVSFGVVQVNYLICSRWLFFSFLHQTAPYRPITPFVLSSPLPRTFRYQSRPRNLID